MNYSTAIFLINTKARAIMGIYNPEEPNKKTLYKTLDQTIAVDDYVLVQTDTRHKMTVVKVVEIDVDFDLESSAKVSWVLSKVDLTIAENLMKLEADAISQIKKAELRQKRDNLRDALFKDHTETLKTLEIADMGEAKASLPSPDIAPAA